MPDKKQILKSIVDIARKLGRPPSLSEFLAATRISKYRASQFFPSWNEAVSAAGFDPYSLNMRVEESELLKDWGETVRKSRSVPSRRAYGRMGKFDLRTLERRFGSWSRVPQAFRTFAEGKPEWADVLPLLPVPLPEPNGDSPSGDPALPILRNKARHAPLKGRPTYGDPMDFRGLRHKPVNEQGVVFLFGMVAKELGYHVEGFQKEFPDCEAKRQIGPERWQRVYVEFEFESRNFRDHGHPRSGCDVIVCWRHNWDECPEDIDVVELSSVIQSLANSED